MSRCTRCNGCRDQWSEAKGKLCPHCGYPGTDTRSPTMRADDAFDMAMQAVNDDGVFSEDQIKALHEMLDRLRDALWFPGV